MHEVTGPDRNNFATSFNSINYSGMLFNKGNTRTPLSSIIGSKAKITNHIKFVVGQDYTTEGASKDFKPITEVESLKAPPATFIERRQTYNITQIFHESVGISYVKQSNMGSLSGVNISNQKANPINELDFQVAAKIQKINRDIEYTFINSKFLENDSKKSLNDKPEEKGEGHRTRGLIEAVSSNTKNMEGKPIGLWDVAELVKIIYEKQAPTEGLCLWCNATTLFQINADATQNGLTVVPAAREINGISLSSIITPIGVVYLYLGECLPDDQALLLNLDVIAPVYQPVPGKGNFFLEPLAKTGAGEQYQLFGQLGLDYGPEWYHGKFTGISNKFDTPTYSRSVHVSNANEIRNISIDNLNDLMKNINNILNDSNIKKLSEAMIYLTIKLKNALDDVQSKSTTLSTSQTDFKNLLNSTIDSMNNKIIVSEMLFTTIKCLDTNNNLTEGNRTAFYNTMFNICDQKNKEIMITALNKAKMSKEISENMKNTISGLLEAENFPKSN